MLKNVKSTCALTALGALTLAAQVTTALPAVQTTGMVGLADAQTAQLNLLNPGVLAPAIGIICKANVSFVDAGGTVLKSTTLTVTPGQSQSFSLRSDVDLNLIAGAFVGHPARVRRGDIPLTLAVKAAINLVLLRHFQ